MRFDKISKRIMNLDPISVFRESWCIKFGGCSDEQAKCLKSWFLW